MPVISITTDFGLKDSYVAQMKGVLLSICPGASIVDVCHELPHGDIFAGALMLRDAAGAFPDGSIHVAVVDPGVGGSRRRIIVEAQISNDDASPGRKALFVGPDNGLFSFVSRKSFKAWQIVNLNLLPRVEQFTTFDGRDVFAPAAAMLAVGRSPEEFGPEISRGDDPLVLIEMPEASADESGDILGQVIRVDHFGNAVTNVKAEELPLNYFVRVSDCSPVLRPAACYQEIPDGELGVLVNSGGYLEIAANMQAAAELMPLCVGTCIRVSEISSAGKSG